MRRHRIIATAVLLALFMSFFTAMPAMASGAQTPGEYDGYIMKLRDDAVVVLSADGPKQVEFCDGVYLIDEPSDAMPYLESGLVEYIEPNYILELLEDVPNDTKYNEQWSLAEIGYPALYNSGKNGDGVTVAVIDSGLYAWTENDQYKGQEDFETVSISAHSRNFLGQGAEEYYYRDQKGHGTFVASQIAAKTGNGMGISGVADGVELMILRCISASSSKTFPFNSSMDSNSGSAALVASAIRYAADNGADIINLSLGSQNAGSGVTLGDALAYAAHKDVIIVAAVGNAGSTAVYYPAGNENVIGVGSVDSGLVRSSFSQYNSSVDVTAPGGAVLGTDIYADGTGTALVNSYAAGSGTSYAAPVVSALAAIVKQYNKALDHDDFMSLLAASCTDKGTAGKDNNYGYGVVNAQALLGALDAEYGIEYVLNDDTESKATLPTEYVSSYKLGRSEDISLPIPSRDGYAFTGWHELPTLSDEATSVLPTGALAFAEIDQATGTYSIPALKYYAGWESYDAAKLSSVTVKEYAAKINETGTDYSVKLPKGSVGKISEITANDIEITCADKAAQVSELGTADGGATWSFKVSAGTAIEKTYTLSVALSVLAVPTAPVLKHSGTAMLGSIDGVKQPSAYTADVSKWFENASEYSIISNTGSGTAEISEATLSYMPGADDFDGQTISLSVGAANADFASRDTVTVAVTIGRAESNSTVTPKSKELDIYKDTSFTAELTMFANTLVSVSAGANTLSEGKDYTLSDGELDSQVSVAFTKSFLQNLTPGEVNIIFKFSGGENAVIALTIIDTAPRYDVKYYLNSTDNTAYSVANIRTGDKITTLPVQPTKAGYTFTGWYLKDGTTRITANTKVTSALDVYASWLADSTSGGGVPGGGGIPSGGGAPGGGTSEPEVLVPVGGMKAAAHMEETTAVLELADDEIASIIADNAVIGVDISDLMDADSVLIPSALLSAKGLEIKFADGTITPDKASLAGFASNGGDLKLSVKPGKDDFGRTVFSLSAFLGGKAVTKFDGRVRVELPYNLQGGERAGDIVVALRSEKGVYERTDCEYDPRSGMAIVQLNHFSDYVVAAFPFDDVTGDKWYYGGVLNTYLNGIFTGNSPRSFAPMQTTNRAMFVTALWRLEGCPLPKSPGSFSDVPRDKWYSSAIAWASENKIVDGYKNGRFGPLDELNREQMMTILYRYEKYKGGGFSGDWMFRLSFADAANVSDWAYEAACWCTMQGIVDGVGENMLLPAGESNRAQLAEVLSRCVSKK